MMTTTSPSLSARRLHIRLIVATITVLVLASGGSARRALQAQGACGANPIQCENLKTGNPASEWDIAGSGDPDIQGFATDISVNRGETVHFKISSQTAYDIHIYRLGYYPLGAGARKVGEILG